MARSRVLLACLTVLLTPLAFAQNAVAPAAAQQSVSGTVVDVRDGHRIRNATVRLVANGGGSRIEPTTTDEEGRFNFAAVPAGKYNLSAVARGFFSAAYLEHEGFYTSIVTGAGLETTGLQLQLTRLGTIYGSVLDDAGEPGMNTQVSLYRVDPAGDSRPYIRAGITNTDADGRYSFKRLMPGRYFLSVNATPWFAVHPRKDQPHAYLPYRTAVDAAVDVVYPTTFYPHATRAEDARPIDLESGDEFPANLTLTPEHSLTLSIQFPPQPAGVPIQYPQIQLLRRVFGRDEYVQQSGSEFNDGVLSITGVAAGTYTVMRSPSGNSFAVPLREIDLSPDSTSMLMPAAPALAPLTVHVHADPAITPTAQAQVQLKKKLADQYASAPLRSNGEAVINGLSPGEYTVNIIANGAQFRVKSLVVEGKVVRGNTAERHIEQCAHRRPQRSSSRCLRRRRSHRRRYRATRRQARAGDFRSAHPRPGALRKRCGPPRPDQSRRQL